MVAVLLSFLLAVGSLPEYEVAAAGSVASTKVTLSGNLDVNALDGDSVPQSATIYDASGATHTIDFSFIKVPNAAAWDWDVGTSDPTISSSPPFASGTITFNQAGVAQTNPAQPEGVMPLAFTTGAASALVTVEMDAMTSKAQATSLTATANGGATGGGTSGSPAPATGAVKRVTIFGKRYTPSVIRVAPGTKIVFRNGDRLKHTITGNTFRDKQGGLFNIAPHVAGEPPPPIPDSPYGLLGSPVLDARPEPTYPGGPRPAELPSSLFEFTPPAEGSYAFHCTIHKGMGGLIVVGKESTAGTSGNPTPTPAPPPPGPTKTPARKPALITIFGNRFRPDKLEVSQGTTVTFRNGDRPKPDGSGHRIAGTSYRDPNGVLKDWEPVHDPTNPLDPSGLPSFQNTFTGRPPPVPGNPQRAEDTPYTYTFTEPGTYNFRGELGSMRGTIVVSTPTPTP